MGTKITLPLVQSGANGEWNKSALRDWNVGNKCVVTDGTHEMYGPYSLDAVAMSRVVLDGDIVPNLAGRLNVRIESPGQPRNGKQALCVDTKGTA